MLRGQVGTMEQPQETCGQEMVAVDDEPDKETQKQMMLKRHRKKDGKTVSRRESVQEWLENMADMENVATDMDKSVAETESEAVKHDHNANIEDDLFLGAEAKLIRSAGSKERGSFDPLSNKENLLSRVDDTERRDKLSRLTRSTTLESPSNTTPPPLSGLQYRRLSLQKRFQLQHADSFQSNDSSKTYNSVNELLQERSSNPIEILTNLGFGGVEETDKVAVRVPTRFLKNPSKAQGIQVEDFIERHPQIRKTLLEEESRGQPILLSDSFISGGNRSPSSTADSLPELPPPVSARKNSLFSAARNVILLNRFSSSIPSSHPDDTALHEGVTETGKLYQSILHPDNTEFFVKQGLYEASAENKVRRKSKVLKTENSLDITGSKITAEEVVLGEGQCEGGEISGSKSPELLQSDIIDTHVLITSTNHTAQTDEIESFQTEPNDCITETHVLATSTNQTVETEQERSQTEQDVIPSSDTTEMFKGMIKKKKVPTATLR